MGHQDGRRIASLLLLLLEQQVIDLYYTFLTNNDTDRKGISRGAEWCKFQLRSTFQ